MRAVFPQLGMQGKLFFRDLVSDRLGAALSCFSKRNGNLIRVDNRGARCNLIETIHCCFCFENRLDINALDFHFSPFLPHF